MLTATSRVCDACGRLLPAPPAAAVCDHCGRVAVPLHDEWPAGFKKWLVKQWLTQFWAPWRASTEQYRWEQLVRVTTAGTTAQGRLIPVATPIADCFAEAIRRFTSEQATNVAA